jgi:hypothetical protein
MVDLTSAKAKIARAKVHAEAAGRILQKFVGPDFYEAVPEADRKRRLIVRIVKVQTFPAEFALAVGDALHNLRSALDHVVYACAAQPLTSKEERSIQFPLTSTRKAYLLRRNEWLPKVPRNARALVDRFQPHHRRKWPENRLLAQLQAVDNWDKHRRLSITATHVKRSELRVNVVTGDAQVTKQVIFSGRVKVGTVLAKFDMANVSEDAQAQVSGKLVVIPVFGVGMPKEVFGLSVLNRMLKIGRFIETTVIPQFEALSYDSRFADRSGIGSIGSE